MATLTLTANFYINNRTDVEMRTHKVDVTDDIAEMVIAGRQDYDIKEDLADRESERLNWVSDENFITWLSVEIA